MTQTTSNAAPGMNFWLWPMLLLALWMTTGCEHIFIASYPVNTPLTHFDRNYGYRFVNMTNSPTNSDSLLIIMAFSGGGTRAAAYSYGVLETLRDTPIVWEGNTRRLLDEVDWISSVSGGSFTAAYYALFHDRIFTDFEPLFLRNNIQNHLLRRAFLNPPNLARLASPFYDRSDLAGEFYHKEIFQHKTYQDLVDQATRPFLTINASDMSLKSRFSFTQEQFDFIGSDLGSIPVARAVAASSAFPVLMSPITLRNYTNSVGNTNLIRMLPNLYDSPNDQQKLSPRMANRIQESRSYLDATNRPYLHLLDGGLSDNLGLRGPLDSILMHEPITNFACEYHLENIRKVALIVVDSSVEQPPTIGMNEISPGLLTIAMTTATIPISRYSFETIELFKQYFEQWQKEFNQAKAARGKSNATDRVSFQLFHVRFEDMQNEAYRKRLNKIPTAFCLSNQDIDLLRYSARNWFATSQDWQKFLKELNGTSPALPKFVDCPPPKIIVRDKVYPERVFR